MTFHPPSFLDRIHRIFQDFFFRSLILSILLILSLSSDAQMPVPPAVPSFEFRVSSLPRPARTISIRWTESANAAGYVAWTWFETDPARPIEQQLGRTNRLVIVTTNRARLFAAIAARNADGVASGEILQAHWPKYPDVFDHLLLTCNGGSPPFTIFSIADCRLPIADWELLTVLDTYTMEIGAHGVARPTFYRASSEEETTLELTRVYKPDPREL